MGDGRWNRVAPSSAQQLATRLASSGAVMCFRSTTMSGPVMYGPLMCVRGPGTPPRSICCLRLIS